LKKKVFILGSGFSKAINSKYPTLIGLTEDINSKFLLSCINSALKSHFISLKSSLKDNIELLLSYLVSDMPFKTEQQHHLDLALYSELTEIIREYFYDLDSSYNREETNKKNNIIELFKMLHYQNVPVITLNYDTLFESIYLSSLTNKEYTDKAKPLIKFVAENRYLFGERKTTDVAGSLVAYQKTENDKYQIFLSERLIGRWSNEKEFIDNIMSSCIDPLNEYVKIYHSDDYNNPFEKSNIQTEFLKKVYKNFQSIEQLEINMSDLYRNLFQNIETISGVGMFGGEKTLSLHLLKLHGSINWYYSGLNSNPTEMIYYYNYFSGELDKDIVQDKKPYIVPPIFDKNALYVHNTLRSLWRASADYLKEADNIYIIGFSLPQTDFTLKALLQSNIKDDAKIYIINKPKDEKDQEYLKEKYKESFSNQATMGLINFEYCNCNNDVLNDFIEKEVLTGKTD